jgi:uncharacterized repeat protein (TIGR03843 family)
VPEGELMPLQRGFPKARIAKGPHDVRPGGDDALAFVREAEIGDGWLHPQSSNYTFFVELSLAGKRGFGVYKPQAGEAPLWDFPGGTLYQRECASYELNCLLGWSQVPPTVVREGESGVGSLQLYVPFDEDSNFFTIQESHGDDLLKLAVFDLVANNADRKGGHCFLDARGTLWAVDHGLTFHTDHKLRTVIWDYAGQTAPDHLVRDLSCALDVLCRADAEATERLAALMSGDELNAVRRRMQAFIETPLMPHPYSRRDMPWPWL